MAETAAFGQVNGLIPLAQVADVQRSVDFYKLLGMEMRGSLLNSSGVLQWVSLANCGAGLMFGRASEPVIASQQAVVFYLYSPNLVALREHVLANGIRVSEVTYPEYMPKGEICLNDPDGYTLLIGQVD